MGQVRVLLVPALSTFYIPCAYTTPHVPILHPMCQFWLIGLHGGDLVMHACQVSLIIPPGLRGMRPRLMLWWAAGLSHAHQAGRLDTHLRASPRRAVSSSSSARQSRSALM